MEQDYTIQTIAEDLEKQAGVGSLMNLNSATTHESARWPEIWRNYFQARKLYKGLRALDRYNSRSRVFERRLQALMKKFYASRRKLVLAGLKKLKFNASRAAFESHLHHNELSRDLTTQEVLIILQSRSSYDLNLLAQSDQEEIKIILQDSLQDDIDTWMTKIQAILENTGQAFSAENALQLSKQFPGFPEETQAWIDDHVPKLVDQLNETILGEIEETIVDGIKEGQGLKEITDAIGEVFDGFENSKPNLIAATEVGLVAAQAQQDVLKDLGIPLDQLIQIWYTAQDEHVRESHQEVNGQQRAIGELFSNGLRYPHDPDGPPGEIINCRCLAPGTRLRGRFVGAIRAKYRGPMRRITTREKRCLSITPNHPVLTTQGWIEANLVNQETQLIAYSSQIDEMSLTIDKVNENNGPLSVENLFRSMFTVGEILPVSATGDYFNRDSKFFTSQIDAVTLDPKLMFHRISASLQQIENISFEDSASDLSVSKLGMRFDRIGLERFPFQQFSVGSPSYFDTVFDESTSENPSINSSFVRDLFHRFPLQIALYESCKILNEYTRMSSMSSQQPLLTSSQRAVQDQNLSNLIGIDHEVLRAFINTCSRLIHLDQVESVIDYFHDGFVFDFQSSHGLLLAEDIVTQNCVLLIEVKK